jgi:hypothetical protein
MQRRELIELATQVEQQQLADMWSCPVCEETECDTGCPLEPLRSST